MKEHEVVNCPHCGNRTPVRLKTERDGWTVVGRSFVCAFCGGKLGAPEGSAAADNAAPAGGASAARLRSLLGDLEEPCEYRLEPGSEYRRFCRNCKHFLRHPFLSRCARTGEETDPGSSCPEFSPNDAEGSGDSAPAAASGTRA